MSRLSVNGGDTLNMRKKSDVLLSRIEVAS